MDNNFMYSKQNILENLDMKAGTFYNRIKELGILDNPIYMIKVQEKNRDKAYFTQDAFDLIKDCQKSAKYISNNTIKNVSSDTVKDMSNVSNIPLTVHNDILIIFKNQLEEKDKQINNLQNIINMKEQTTLIEKQKQLNTPSDNKKWYQFWKK